MLRHSINTKKTEMSRQIWAQKATSRNIDFVKTGLCRCGFLPSTTILTSPFATSSICCRKFCARGHYVKNFPDVLKIGWLPINERRDLSLLKLCLKVLHNSETWPDYLKIIKQECCKELRSSNSIRLVVPTENGTFQDNGWSYLTIYHRLLETAKITEPFKEFFM